VIDLGLDKMALIGIVALVVIGPEKLPRVARTVGTLLGKAQRYVNDVKAEVNRSMELEELRKMKDTVETAARDVETSVSSAAATSRSSGRTPPPRPGALDSRRLPEYKHPKKKWRVKQGATPTGTRARRTQGCRCRAASTAPKSS
jgi:sec-independent protein translocase protein TatB